MPENKPLPKINPDSARALAWLQGWSNCEAGKPALNLSKTLDPQLSEAYARGYAEHKLVRGAFPEAA